MSGFRGLNLGCGFAHEQGPGWVNVDAFPVCCPNVVLDLEQTPWPWPSDHFDRVQAYHVLEHLDNWWAAFRECARVLRPGGTLEVRVPDESSSTALGWRDHRHVFTKNSFHGIRGATHGTNAWAVTEQDTVPLWLKVFAQVPHKEFNWLLHFPRVLRFCAAHMRNFIHEQRFVFVKEESLASKPSVGERW